MSSEASEKCESKESAKQVTESRKQIDAIVTASRKQSTPQQQQAANKIDSIVTASRKIDTIVIASRTKIDTIVTSSFGIHSAPLLRGDGCGVGP